jgi:LAS superfamily LD-carboxypeptidase LdcB
MQNRRNIFTVVAAVVAVLAVMSFGAYSQSSQSQSSNSTSTVKPTVRIMERPASANPSTAFMEAAERNLILKNELSWTYGGKQQLGWYLYDPLIRQTLNIENDSSTSDFAAALSLWQRQSGLPSDGVLDENTLIALISNWQSNRLKNRDAATQEQLVMPPASEFYDPDRLPELRQVERNTYAAYKKMLAAAVADPSLNLEHTTSGDLAPTEKFFKIISAFRSREYQEELRRKSPNAGSAGLAVNSPHFTGRALDIYVGGDPVDTKDSNRLIQINTPVYKWLVQNAGRFGFRPYFYEPWHWEYVK